MNFLRRIAPLFIFMMSVSATAIAQGDVSGTIINSSTPVQNYRQTGIDYKTGAATLTIPLFSETAMGVKVDVNLNYYSTGLKGADPGSTVGVGWNLEVGGVITRRMVGVPDEVPGSSSLPGYFSERNNYQNYDACSATSYCFGTGEMPDQFEFNFLGRRGEFSFLATSPEDEYGEDLGKIVTTPYQDLKITYVVNHNATNYIDPIVGFIITDENGYRYYFGDFVLQPRTQGGDPIVLEGTVKAALNGDYLHPFYQAWHLTYIETPDDNPLYKFNYWQVNYNVNPSEYIPISRKVLVPVETPNNDPSPYLNNMSPCPMGAISEQTEETNYSKLNDVYLSTIQMLAGYDDVPNTAEGYTINFFYTYRVDKEGLLKLEGVYKNDPRHQSITDFRFAYDYFITPTTDGPSRLMLTSVQELGSSANNSYLPYVFTYFNPGLTPRTSTPNIDAWGYLNSLDEPLSELDKFERMEQMVPSFNYTDRAGIPQTYLGNDRTPTNNLITAKVGMLTAVKYPNLSELTYEYELNQAYAKDFFDHINLTTSSESNRLCGGVRVKKITKTFARNTTGDPYPEDNYMDQREYFYETVDASGNLTGQSSGYVFNPSPMAYRYMRYKAAGDIDGAGPLPVICFECNEEYLNVFDEDPLTSSYPNRMVYSAVTEVVKSSTGNIGGKKIYYYDAFEQTPSFSNQSLPLNQRVNWVTGGYNYTETLLSKLETYKFEGGIYKLEKKLTYNFITVENPLIEMEIFDVHRLFSATNPATCYDYNPTTGISSTPSNYTPILAEKKIVEIHPHVSRLLEYEYQTVYDDNGEAVTSETKYNYDNYNQLIEERKSSSDDTYYFTKYFRVTDFGTPPLSVHNSMINRHIHTPIIEKVVFSNNNNVFDGNEKILSGNYTLFEDFSGKIKPKTLLRLNISEPLNPLSLSFFDDAGYDNQYYKPINQFLDYNSNGELLSYKNENGVQVNYKYSSEDPDFKVLLAVSKNTTIDKVFYTAYSDYASRGFSADFSPIIPRTPSFNPFDIGRVGGISLNLTLSGATQMIPEGKYIISCWTKEIPGNPPILNVSGSYLTVLKQHVSNATPDGWVLNNYVVNVSQLSEVIISGNQLLDVVRMYPFDAQLTTYTYNLNHQVISVTDENETIIFYEYDSMYRLKAVRDGNNNLIEERKYHSSGLLDDNY